MSPLSGATTAVNRDNRVVGEPAAGVLRLVGGDGSPYSNKMKSFTHVQAAAVSLDSWKSARKPRYAFTFARIRHESLRYAFIFVGTPNAKGPVLAPKLLFPDDRVMNDSTMLIKELEHGYSGRLNVTSSVPLTTAPSYT